MQVPMPDDWDGESFCRWAVCWPDSIKWKAILSGLLESPTQGRFWDFETGNFLDLRALFRPAYDYNFELKGVLMACQDQAIAEALQAIATALTNQTTGGGGATINQSINCCEETIINVGGGVQGSVPGDEETGDTPIYGSVPPIGLPTGEFPPEFPDLATYQQDKCEMANLMIDNIITQLRAFSFLPLVNSTALAALVAASVFGIITLPVTIIPLIVAMMIILGTSAFYLDQFADYMADNREEWVCALFQADSSEGAITAVVELIQTGIAFLSITGPIAVAVKAIVLALFNSDTVNKLFQYTAHAIYEGADCSSCVSTEGCFDFEAEQDLLGWTVIDQSGGTVDLSIVTDGMLLETGNPSDTQHTVFSSPLMNYTVQAGDEFNICFLSDPVPYGMVLIVVLDNEDVTLENSGTIVDHITDVTYSINAYEGQVLSDVRISINRAFGGTWTIRRIGVNCLCENP